MRTFTLKGLFLTAVFMVLGCLAIHAADDDLITRQITVKLDEAGTLPDKIGSIKKYKLTNLKIVGEINGTDLCFIREMAGRNVNGTAGKLAILDLSEAKIVEGGDCYYGRYYYTSDDVIGSYAFYDCSGLTSVTIPSGVTSIGQDAFYNCSGLTSVYVSWESPLSINASIFVNANTKSCILYVPKGTYDDYFISNWGVFDNIEEYDVTGIDNVTTSSDVKEISRYSVNGQRLKVPTKGLNIVKYSDGSVKKVVVQ